jgi:hypothetical protein
MPPALVFFVGLLIAITVGVIVIWRKEKERTEALRRVAALAGLTFTPTADVAELRSLGDVQLFARGHSKRVTNLMTGRLGDRQMAVFDYQFTVGSGKGRHTTTQTVVVLPSAKGSLPDLQMAPENPLTRIAEAFGYQDIDIESAPEFSRRYILRGADEAAVRAALHPSATSYFAGHEGWSVEVQSGTVGIYRADWRPKPEDVRTFIEDACAAASSF